MTRKQVQDALLFLFCVALFVWAVFIALDEDEPSVKQQWDQKYPANSER